MPSPERSRIREYVFKGAEILFIGFALISALGTGIGLTEGDYAMARNTAFNTAVYALIAGGIIYAERHLARKNNPRPPGS